MLRPILIALTLSLALPLSAQAQTAAEQAYIDYQGALIIDDQCHFLRHFERQNTADIDKELLMPLELYIDYNFGVQDVEAIRAEQMRLIDLAKQKVASIACTDNQSAAPYILGLRDRISHYLYNYMMIGFQSGRMSEEQKRAASAFEAMITPLYGEGWQGFVELATQRAQFNIDDARRQDEAANPFSALWGDDFDDEYLYFDEEEDLYGDYGMGGSTVYFDALILMSLAAADDIFFNLTAEEAGYRIETHYGAGGSGQVTGFFTAERERPFDLFQVSTAYPTIEMAGPIKLAMLINSAGEGRIMAYGEHARRLAEGSITFLVHPEKLPSDQNSDYTFLRSDEWWNAAEVIKAEPVDEPCLGGPCFALTKATMDMIGNGAYGQAFRFYLSVEANPEMPAPSSGQVYTGYNCALQARDTFLATSPE